MSNLLTEAFGDDGSQLVAEERQKLLSRLLSRLAHEIRNPLSSLDIHVQLLEEDLGRVPAQWVKPMEGRLEIIRTELHRLDNIVHQFLKLAGPSSVTLQPVNLAETLRHVGELLGPEAKIRGIHLQSGVAPDLPSIWADASQLTQALVNLVINAIQAVGQNGQIEILATFPSGAPHVVIEVRDTGPGIPPEKRTLVFEPFFTTKPEGSGLGLWIVQQIARAHGGSVSVANSATGGAVFTLRLPVNPKPTEG